MIMKDTILDNPKMSKNIAAKVQIFFQITKCFCKKYYTYRASLVFIAFSFLLTKIYSHFICMEWDFFVPSHPNFEKVCTN
jgi:hypothetical protein